MRNESNKPNKWIAAVLGLALTPFAYLYLGSPGLAALFFVVQLGLAVAEFMRPDMAAVALIQMVLGLFCAIHAYRLAERHTATQTRPWYARWYSLWSMAVLLLVAILLFRMFAFEPFRVPSSAMAPTLLVKSALWVQKWGYGHYSVAGFDALSRPMSQSLQRGDIIVFDAPQQPAVKYLKRVIGLPGDTIVYRDKHVLINGIDTRVARLDDYLDPEYLVYFQRYRERLGAVEYEVLIDPKAPALSPATQSTLPAECVREPEALRCTVPTGAYFVMGDHRDNSLDSRYWGFVAQRAVVGKVVAVVNAQ